MDAIRRNISTGNAAEQTESVLQFVPFYSSSELTNRLCSLALPSILIGLLETTKFRNRYLPLASLHSLTCPKPDPRDCFNCQMHKLTVAVHDSTDPSPVSRLGTKGLAFMLTPPTTIGDLTGTSTMFFEILDLCRNISIAQGGKDGIFERMKIQVEVRTECNQCKGVSYTTEKLEEIRGMVGNMQGADVAAATFWSIDAWASAQEKKFDCPACKGKTSLVYVVLCLECTILMWSDWNKDGGDFKDFHQSWR